MTNVIRPAFPQAPAIRCIIKDESAEVIAFPHFSRSDDLSLLLRSLRRLDAAVEGAEEVARRAAERADLLERLHVELADEIERGLAGQPNV